MLISMLLLLAAVRIAPPEGATDCRQPQLAAAGSAVGMAFGCGTSIWYAGSRDGGRSFQTPVRVADTAALALGRHRGPRLAVLRDGLAITAVAGDQPGQPGNLWTWRSVDGGKTWTRGGTVNDVAEAAREGLHAVTATSRDVLYAAWLDLRTKGTRLYGARSEDGGRTWSRNIAIYASPDGTICQCCHPSLAAGDDGGITAMWRNAVDGARDLYFASSADGLRFDAAAKLGEGTWMLQACPMDGGGLALWRGAVLSVWRREGDILLAEAGRAERRLGAGKDPALARTARGVFVAWTGKDGSIQLLRPGAGAAEKIGEGGFASLVGLEDGSAVAAWDGRGGIEAVRVE